MRMLFSFFIFCLLAMSCKEKTSDNGTSASGADEIKILEAQVMAVHDEVMPKMNDIGHLSAQLRDIKASVVEDAEERKEIPQGLEEVVASLKLAEQGMWDWMKAYSDTKATLTEEQLKPFMENQILLINKVKVDMLSSIEKAQSWIAANPSK